VSKAGNITILAALVVMAAAGYSVFRVDPAPALELRWDSAQAGGCYSEADGYLLRQEINGLETATDTIWANHVTVPWVVGKTARYKVAAFCYARLETVTTAGDTVESWWGPMLVGMARAADSCAILPDTLWSPWSAAFVDDGPRPAAPGRVLGTVVTE